MIKEIRINIKIINECGNIKKHNWIITGFMHRKLLLTTGNKFHIKTATQIRDYFMKLLRETK